MQPRVRQLHLRLDAGDLQDPEPRGLAGGVPQQRGLADAGLAADHQRAAAAATRVVEEPIQGATLAGSAPECRRARGGGHARATLPECAGDEV